MEKKDWSNLKTAGELSSLGFVLVFSIVLGFLIGYALDSWLKVTSPWLTFFFLFMGIVAGFYHVIKAALPKRKSDDENGRT